MKHNSNSGMQSVLGEGSRVEGTSRIAGMLRVDGAWDGSIDVGETLVVGKTGAVSGDIRAKNVIVCGRVQGSISASDSVELQKGCRLEGDIHTRTFVVEEGVFFQGHCRMIEEPTSGSEKTLPPRPPSERTAVPLPIEADKALPPRPTAERGAEKQPVGRSLL
ncbi:MAG TPA: polymer-forming cytoskeletal protein [Gemmatimonadota bacterium]|jgi:cytoskeletal protein CcmA (bactofilin family)